ncbi:MAG: TonB-dependent receptor [Acidobacteria bacterium]|nr:TonB-dependent receptor [Acidobacteriota bacterium]
MPSSAVLILALFTTGEAQSTATLQGRVSDPDGSIIPGVEITLLDHATGVTRIVKSDSEGNYQVAAMPVGTYRVKAQVTGFQTQVVERLNVEVGRTHVRDFCLRIGEFSQELNVISDNSLIDEATTSVGHVINQRTVQEIPLNGRYFLDLGLLIPGSVTPPQGAFSASPFRGQGALAINTAGNREETVNYMINGITINNLAFSSIGFQPSVNTIQEFKVDNSTFSAEYGQSSGAIVNIATRSGTNQFHGELFEFLRNDALDARNFFNFTSSEPPPFKRNQFGGHLGGPIVKNRAFFFFSYEGLRQRQGLDLNSLVLSDAERKSATDPVIVKLIELIPRANFFDGQGTPRFIGSATAPVNVDHWTIDISHNLREKDRMHGYYAIQRVELSEPIRVGNTIPGFGHNQRGQRQVLTLNETHTFSPALVNTARFGFNRLFGILTPVAQLSSTDFGIFNGISEPIGLPQINIAGGSLNFGGPGNQPAGRSDTTFVVSDTLTWLRGAHFLKVGGEYRQYLNNNFRLGSGTFNFMTVAAFLANIANSFSVTLGNQSSSISQGVLGLFVQDNYRLRSNLTFELGLRYDWNMTPTERFDRFIVFDPQTASLERAGSHFDEIYHQNNKNFQPRFGFAWDPFRNGKTVLRGAYAILVDQPMTSVVTGTSANPPLALPLTFTGPIGFDNAINLARPAGLAPQTVDHDFNNAYMQSWNLNAQRELTPDLAVMVGYFGSKGTHLILRRNINQPMQPMQPGQPLSRSRPHPGLSESSPILPGSPLGNITQVESSGNSSYNALWVTANQRLTTGLQFIASYTWSKSIDYNSFSSQGVVVQNSNNLRGDRGLSDFDARHRFVVSVIYQLPFRGNRFVEGWQLGAIVVAQSGNPINIVTGNSMVNGLANTLRPDVTGPIRIIGNADRWFDTSVFTPVPRFGSLGRNVVIGPGFNNTDFSVIKNIKIGEIMRVQFRAEFFDLFNHANFGQPGNMVGSPAFFNCRLSLCLSSFSKSWLGSHRNVACLSSGR